MDLGCSWSPICPICRMSLRFLSMFVCLPISIPIIHLFFSWGLRKKAEFCRSPTRAMDTRTSMVVVEFLRIEFGYDWWRCLDLWRLLVFHVCSNSSKKKKREDGLNSGGWTTVAKTNQERLDSLEFSDAEVGAVRKWLPLGNCSQCVQSGFLEKDYANQHVGNKSRGVVKDGTKTE